LGSFIPFYEQIQISICLLSGFMSLTKFRVVFWTVFCPSRNLNSSFIRIKAIYKFVEAFSIGFYVFTKIIEDRICFMNAYGREQAVGIRFSEFGTGRVIV